jgi:hypothetical protein
MKLIDKSERHLKLLSLAILLLLAAPVWAQSDQTVPLKDGPAFLAWMQQHHKAPFNRPGPVASQAVSKASQAVAVASQTRTPQAPNASPGHIFRNVKVNQDRNPWAKAGIASAVDASDAKNWVVMSTDYRVNFPRMFYHVSTDGGNSWTDDLLVEGSDPYIGAIPLTYQANPGLSFDHAGNSFLSALSVNSIVDFNNNYVNSDSEVDVVQGYAHGTYSSDLPTLIDAQSCSGMIFGPSTCNGTLSQPMNSTDANANSPDAGTNYVYYSFFCNLPTGSCTDGTATIPSFGSAILESHSPAAGEPFSTPALVSGSLVNAQYSYMVIDPSGTPHIFFDDYTNAPLVKMWESTLTGGVWTVSKNPVASFVYTGYNALQNPNWSFNASGGAMPGCGIHGYTAYCAFSATQVAGGNAESTPSVYLASVNLTTGASRVTRVNNDPFNHMKDHFFAWATATPEGAVYVGWYDDRNDPTNTNVEYFVGKSFDEGRTFPIQKAVSDVPFNPCNGIPGCAYFGDYTQLASGPDGVVHAAWSDTRDGVSMQLWSQTVLF